MQTTAIDKYTGVIDSRDVIDRINDLHETQELGVLNNDERAELKALEALAEECEGYAEDGQYSVALIRSSYFKKYAQELAADCDAIGRDAVWPQTCIDWDQAARELQLDYTEISYDGVAYWVR